jgi:type II secretory pathway pseudopilin PulG
VTLLEALIALVILGLAAVATLGAIETSASATTRAEEWIEAVARAESAMERTKLGPEDAAALPGSVLADGHSVSLRARPDLPGVNELAVTVDLPDGRFVLQRLVRAP